MTVVKIDGNVLFGGLVGSVLENDGENVVVNVIVKDGLNFNVKCKVSEVKEIDNTLSL